MKLFSKKKSKIHGDGIIINKSVNKNTIIGDVIEFTFYVIPVRTSNLGMFLNHSIDNNCKLIYKNNKYKLVATKKINKNNELTLNYNDTPWFIFGSWIL